MPHCLNLAIYALTAAAIREFRFSFNNNSALLSLQDVLGLVDVDLGFLPLERVRSRDSLVLFNSCVVKGYNPVHGRIGAK